MEIDSKAQFEKMDGLLMQIFLDPPVLPPIGCPSQIFYAKLKKWHPFNK